MKAKMYSQRTNTLLHDHIFDGFNTTHEGLHLLREQNLIDEKEYVRLLEMNITRLVARIHEFRIAEGIMEAGKRALSIFFAIIFTYMQATGDDLEMRRPTRGRSGRRRNESEMPTRVGSMF